MDERYYCYKCGEVEYFNSRRKTHPCRWCEMEMLPLGNNKVLNGKLYNPYVYSGATELIIPDGVEEMESLAYSCKSSIQTIVFPSSLKKIPVWCFDNCKSLSKLNVPGSIKDIGSSAFKSCASLKEVILDDGIELIGKEAFLDCKQLTSVKLPKTIKKIGERAFHTDYQTSFRVIALPKSITEIGEDAFGKEFKSEVLFLVAKDSFAEEFVKERKFKFDYFDGESGFISCDEVVGGKLYCPVKIGSIIKINDNVEIIEKRAFVNQKQIKEIIFPPSLREIKDESFIGCSSINKVSFNEGLQTIGSRAFQDAKLLYIDLPSSVIHVASDAFPQRCTVSIGGEMPGYNMLLTALKEKQLIIDEDRRRLVNLEEEITSVENQIVIHDNNRPDNEAEIGAYQFRLDELQALLDAESQAKESKVKEYEKQLKKSNEVITQLSIEKSKMFILAITRKRELESRIVAEKAKEKEIRDTIARVEMDFSQKKNQIDSEKDVISREMQRIDDIEIKWKYERRQYEESLEGLKKKSQELSDLINESELSLKQERKEVELSHAKWVEQINKAREAERLTELCAQKTTLISELKLPTASAIVHRFDYRNSIVDEKLINDVYKAVITNQKEIDRVSRINQYIIQNASKIQKVKELNQQMGLKEDDQIEAYYEQEVPELITLPLPERFTELNEYFQKLSSWKAFMKVAKGKSMAKKPKENFCDCFFSGLEYLSFSDRNATFLLFPYCSIIFWPNEQMKLYTYDRLKIKVSCKEIEEETEKIPPKGELIHQRYKHANADGSPNKRYKDNPIISTIRFTNIAITYENRKSIEIPIKENSIANSIVESLNEYIKDLKTGSKRSIYKCVVDQLNLEEIRLAISQLAQKEKEEEQKRIKKLEAEKKRIEKERLAAEAEAEAKRIEIIKRQLELNEERKRQAEEKKKKSLQIAQLFDDDFTEKVESPSSAKKDAIETIAESSLPVEIIGNKTVSNNVFKVVLKVKELIEGDMTVFFTDPLGTVISNKKKAALVPGNENITLGFVLNDGVDYTVMKRCYLQLEHQDQSIGRIEYKMNISFSPDIF